MVDKRACMNRIDIRSDLPEKDACGVGFIFRPAASHRVISDALHALAGLEHRGACGSDGESSDGAGILTAIPEALLVSEGFVGAGRLAVGMLFMPVKQKDICMKLTEEVLAQESLNLLGWREVPVNLNVLGTQARLTRPHIAQVIIDAPGIWTDEDVERRLFTVRKRLEMRIHKEAGLEEFCIPSFSSKSIVYKGMVRSAILSEFYADLKNPLFKSKWAVFHRRFSTNTLPRWALAQPFRMLGHNGEINTLLGNRNWLRAKEHKLKKPDWCAGDHGWLPVISSRGSDSADLDNVLETLVRSDNSAEQALMQLIPEAYRSNPEIDNHPNVRDFYDYYSALQEPWDGPALIVYSDGNTVGATLDRNGLRPARYKLLEDGTVILASEAGVFEVPAGQIVENGRLGPGQMISVDIETGRVLKNWEIKTRVASKKPYGEWLGRERQTIGEECFSQAPDMSPEELLAHQLSFGYGADDVNEVITRMAVSRTEPIFSMGDDTPLAVLSKRPRTLYDYFKQRFAQVTNPPIDPLREKLVMSLDVHLGARTVSLQPTKKGARTLRLRSPFLTESQLREVESIGGHFQAQRLTVTFEKDIELGRAVEKLAEDAVAAVKQGAAILILSDRGIGPDKTAIPLLLATAAVHHRLIDTGLRMDTSIVVEAGQVWTTHHFACLLGYGAQAVCPYLALATIRHWFNMDRTRLEQSKEDTNQFRGLSEETTQENYKRSIEKGLLKILSKMGISAMSSYIGAQIFETIGLGPAVINSYFRGTHSPVGGLEIEDIGREILRFHKRAYPQIQELVDSGMIRNRKGGEYHANSKELVSSLHRALGLKAKDADDRTRAEEFQKYSGLLQDRPPTALRDLLTFESDRPAIPAEEVEPALEIAKRFCTGAMSLGALSKEAHEVLAIAMNRIGAKSNSGEGGEDPLRYRPAERILTNGTSPDFPGLNKLKPGDHAGSAIRQVASGRFGVTTEYLVTAEQIEIKMAQGAKPGEGGQLPGHKVSGYIGKLRASKPGVQLISPPPHHDIYSIEDLAQLIFDMHQVNPKARVSVKLVAETGIGTIAAGVAKANADIIQISGHDGGTGASPLSSIKHAGMPWELGLSETHRSLISHGLRGRVQLRVDGGLRSGQDVVMAALMGADEFGFGSIALMAEGCIMARVCHTNNCPVGIATQREVLRKRFSGSPEPVVEFFLFLAEEVRFILANLGYRSLSELIGRSDLIKMDSAKQISKTASVDLSLLTDPPQQRRRTWTPPPQTAHRNLPTLDDRMLSDPDIQAAITSHGQADKTFLIRNTDRTVSARVAGVIAKKYGNQGFRGRLRMNFEGVAGQSFGAFIVENMHLILTGEANDYVGKGMAGGEIIVRPRQALRDRSSENVIIGNTCLYGATGGRLFAAGRAGERFAVRNSRAEAVIEGAGDHCLEYMTGGTVAVLGPVGRNFAAGMTGGIAFVLDEDGQFPRKLNRGGRKRLQRVPAAAEPVLRKLIEDHYKYTGSEHAGHILKYWSAYLERFWQVVPPSEADNPYTQPEQGKEKIHVA